MFSPNNPFGTSVYLFEEIWLYQNFLTLQKKYPQANWDGLINRDFLTKLPIFLEKFGQEQLLGYTTGLHNIQKGFIKHSRKKINLLTSHAPSREVALNYLNSEEKKVVIINIDAHLDFSPVSPVAGNIWITPEIAKHSIVIGGWDESTQDIKEAKSFFKYIFTDFEDFFENDKIINYLNGAKVYITLDLDYFCHEELCRYNFLGISNYFHRQRFIGHAKTINQVLSEEIVANNYSSEFNVINEAGISLKNGCDIKDFRKSKIISIERMKSKIIIYLSRLFLQLKDLDTSILSLDIVEFSPSCDWENLSLNRLNPLYYDLKNLLLKLEL